MGNIALLLVAAASTLLIAWLVRPATPEQPKRDDYTATRAYELGYAAGRADVLDEQARETNESRPVFDLITGINGAGSRTGT